MPFTPLNRLLATAVTVVAVAAGTTAVARSHAEPDASRSASLSATNSSGSTPAPRAAAPRPGAVTGLVARKHPTTVQLSWQPPAGTDAADASLVYRITAKRTAGPRAAAVRPLTTTGTSVRVHGLRPGATYRFAVRASGASGRGTPAVARVVLPPAPMTAGPAPAVTAASVGSTVSVAAPRPAAWRPAAARFTYTWLADGTPIRGAAGRTFVPGAALAGHRLAVRVTGHMRGYTPASVTTSAVVVASPSPLAGGPWGVYRGPWDGVYPAYQSASGEAKTELAKVALQPRVIWFASNQGTSQVGTNIRNYISGVQAGNANTLVQLALFRIFPGTDGGEGGRDHPLSAAEQSSYKAWMNSAATAIGNARAAVVLEPDLALLAPPTRAGAERTADPAVRESLVKWAAHRLSELPNTTVYLDCGDADWLSVSTCAHLLAASGIGYARGFALGATHYSTVGDNVTYGAALAAALAKVGYPGKHFVIDTADNGQGFTWPYWNTHQGKLGGDFDNAAPCATVGATLCDTLGVPPTATTWGDARLGLSTTQNAQAESLVDGYLWFGRPWLDRQASPFDLKRTLQVARSTPFQ